MFIDIHGHAYRQDCPSADGRNTFVNPKELLTIHDRFAIEKGVLLPLVSPEAIAPACTKMILDILEKKRYKRMSQHIILDTELIIRDSCGYKRKHGETNKHFDLDGQKMIYVQDS